MDFYGLVDSKEYKNNADIILVKPEGFNKENDTEEVREYLINVAIYSCQQRGEIKKDEDFDVICLN